MSEEQGSEDSSQKTEEPTQRRLEEARKKGQVVMSKDLSQWLTLATILLSALTLMPYVVSRLKTILTYFLQHAGDIPDPLYALRMGLHQTILVLAFPIVPIMVVAVMIGLIQTRFLISAEALKPKFSHLSPAKGISRIISKKALVEFLKGLFKMSFVGMAVYLTFRNHLEGIVEWTRMPPENFLTHVQYLSVLLLGVVLMSLSLLVIGDYIFQWFDFRSKMKMSKEDLRKENKESEGDPIIRQRQRQIRMERLRKQMLSDVPKASVVITNPTHFSVALQYEPDTMDAPKVIAKGQDFIALKIREIAKEHNIPILENPPLARALYESVDVGREIPPEHYKAVADVIRLVLQMKKRLF